MSGWEGYLLRSERGGGGGVPTLPGLDGGYLLRVGTPPPG